MGGKRARGTLLGLALLRRRRKKRKKNYPFVRFQKNEKKKRRGRKIRIRGHGAPFFKRALLHARVNIQRQKSVCVCIYVWGSVPVMPRSRVTATTALGELPRLTKRKQKQKKHLRKVKTFLKRHATRAHCSHDGAESTSHTHTGLL